jgi:hypothetical protein
MEIGSPTLQAVHGARASRFIYIITLPHQDRADGDKDPAASLLTWSQWTLTRSGVWRLLALWRTQLHSGEEKAKGDKYREAATQNLTVMPSMYELLCFNKELTIDQKAKDILIKARQARICQGLRGESNGSLLCNWRPRRRRRKTKKFVSLLNKC